MITYVDTSSLLKLLIDEDGSERAVLLWDRADVLASVILVEVEARATLAAAERAARVTVSQHRTAKRELAALLDELTIIEITGDLIARASALAETDALRGCHAVHLAGALAVEATVITSADAELCDAAFRHGLHVASTLDD